jgi:two-component system NtrC family response regulator
LREHREDIIPIAVYHTERICKRSALEVKTFSPDFIEALLSYHWPGNVRELVNATERAIAAAASTPTLFKIHLPREIRIQLADGSTEVTDKKIISQPTPSPKILHLNRSSSR